MIRMFIMDLLPDGLEKAGLRKVNPLKSLKVCPVPDKSPRNFKSVDGGDKEQFPVDAMQK
jgi:hypothetical protein